MILKRDKKQGVMTIKLSDEDYKIINEIPPEVFLENTDDESKKETKEQSTN